MASSHQTSVLPTELYLDKYAKLMSGPSPLTLTVITPSQASWLKAYQLKPWWVERESNPLGTEAFSFTD